MAVVQEQERNNGAVISLEVIGHRQQLSSFIYIMTLVIQQSA